ncbi:T9SS type A sorting domain-containing protein [bacterium SCSIO 12741]|nr:T9SS type A sorting domain-containing protein [bacterium SCSIO 12741]
MKLKFYYLAILLGMVNLGIAQTHTNYIDFEPGNLGGGYFPAGDGNPTNHGYFETNYGVKFYFESGGSYFWARDAKVGGAPYTPGPNTTAKAFTINSALPTNCDGHGQPTTDDFPFDVPAGYDPGCWMLTEKIRGPMQGGSLDLIIDYYMSQILCTQASGYFYDIDGAVTGGHNRQEAWKIEWFVAGSNGVPEDAIYVVSDDWNNCTNCPTLPTGAVIYNALPGGTSYDAGDGRATYWEFETNGQPIDFIKISYVGDTNKRVGVAFDNFFYCSKADQDPCDTEANFRHSINGCMVHFNDITPEPNGGQVIGHFWDFGDGTTSTEEDPSHQYGPFAGSYTVTHEVTIYDGENCCTQQITKEITTDDCEPCEADVEFTWESLCDGDSPCRVRLKADVSSFTQPIAGYFWELGNGRTASGKEVDVYIDGVELICLTTIFAAPDPFTGECCQRQVCATVNCHTSGTSAGEEPAGLAPDQTSNQDSEQSTSTEEVPTPIQDIHVFPNPADDQLDVQIMAQNEDLVSIQLVSLDGREVLSIDPIEIAPGEQKLELATHSFPAGIYLLTVRGQKTNYTQKVQIEH